MISIFKSRNFFVIISLVISYGATASQNPFLKPEKKEDREYHKESQGNTDIKDIDVNSLEKSIMKQDEPVEVELFRINGSTVYKNKQNSTYRIN